MRPTERIRAKALELGFSGIGFAKAERLFDEGGHLQEWLGRGYHGTMEWMTRNSDARVNPQEVLPGAQSVVAVALNYYTDVQHPCTAGTGKISRYAWGDDYHDILAAKLNALLLWMRLEFPGTDGRYYVDTGPVMEKVWAQRAGIGWIAKHSNVITQDHGSWVFLGEIITTLELEYDEPATDHCGTCTLCIEACPTGAIVEPYVVDSNLCLSYLTIEHRGEIAGDIAERSGGWIFGCDICQDVCPWNHKFAHETQVEGFGPRERNVAPQLEEWKNMGQEEFSTKFRGSPVKRAKLAGLLRNIRVALYCARHVKETT
jgi:epoxyqueuosine reductase